MTSTKTTGRDMLRTIKALLSKAEDPSIPEPERLALVAKAADLSAKYGIEQADLDNRSGTDTGELALKEYVVDEDFAREHAALLYWIGEAYGCKGIMRTAAEHGTAEVTLVGYTTDIERTEVMWSSLTLQMADGLMREFPRATVATKRGWLLGFTEAACQKIKDTEARTRREHAAETGSTGTDLVLASRHDQVVKAFRQEFPHTRRTGGGAANSAGYYAGSAAGSRANIGGSSVGNRCRAAIG